MMEKAEGGGTKVRYYKEEGGDRYWHWRYWSLFILIVLLSLSLKIVSPGIEPIRPLHYLGISLLFCCFIWFAVHIYRQDQSSFSVFSTVRGSHFWLACYITLYLLEFPRGTEDSTRSLKDFMYGSAIDFGLLMAVAGNAAFMKNRPAAVGPIIRNLSWSLLAWGFFSALIGWLFYSDVTIAVGTLTLSHNPAWGSRLHGIQGEPTHFGAAVAIGLLSLAYIYTGYKHGKLDLLLLCLSSLMGATLVASGSKNSILALLVALCLMGLFSVKILRLFVFVVAALIIGPALLVSDFNPSLESQKALERRYDADKVLDSLRLQDDGSVGVRLRRANSLFSSFSELPSHDKAFGLGYGALDRHELRSSFNSYLDILVRFGIFHLTLVGCFLFCLARRLVLNVRYEVADQRASIFAISIYGFSFAFSMFMSTWHSMFFHIANIGFIVAFAVVLLSASTKDLLSHDAY